MRTYVHIFACGKLLLHENSGRTIFLRASTSCGRNIWGLGPFSVTSYVNGPLKVVCGLYFCVSDACNGPAHACYAQLLHDASSEWAMKTRLRTIFLRAVCFVAS